MNSGKKWIYIGLLLVFVSGLFAGIVVERRYLSHRHGRHEERGKFPKQEILDRMTKDLTLSGEQRASIDKIFDKHKPEFKGLHKDFNEKLGRIVDEMDSEILAVLDANQKTKYEKFITERKKHRPKD